MFSKKMLLYFLGFFEIEIEGLYIQRFMNLAASKKITIISSRLNKSTVLVCRCFIKDIEKLKEIAKKTGCLITVKGEKGLPAFYNRYKKRKYFIFIIVIVFVIFFINSLFIWNIEIQGEYEDLSEESLNKIIEILNEENIDIGKYKKNLEDKKEKIINKIRLNTNDISWIGIDIKGTNLIVSVKAIVKKDEKASDEEDININKNDNNIYADRDGKIIKMTVLSGTAKVNVGDEIKKGDLVVEGIMEGKYTGIREVEARAEIIIENSIEYEKEMSFKIETKEKTGNVVNKVEIYINNFKINLSKTLLNFENYDTIRENKRVKLFSNYYLPIIFSTLKFEEWRLDTKEYSKNELKEILKNEIQQEFEEDYNISSFEKIDIEEQTKEENDKLKLILKYKVQEKIGTKKD